MADAVSRESQDVTGLVSDHVEEDETTMTTVGSRAAAVSAPTGPRRRWVDRNEFAASVLPHQADPALADDLDRWLDEVTADPHDSGLSAEVERLRRDEDGTAEHRFGFA